MILKFKPQLIKQNTIYAQSRISVKQVLYLYKDERRLLNQFLKSKAFDSSVDLTALLY